MNRELLLLVADSIEKHKAGKRRMAFDMETWGSHVDKGESVGVTSEEHSCGTVACVAGFTLAICHPVVFRNMVLDSYFHEHDIIGQAAKDLGLDDDQANELFLAASMSAYSWRSPLEYVNSKSSLVPDALRWMALTGRIEWGPAFEAAECAAAEKLK